MANAETLKAGLREVSLTVITTNLEQRIDQATANLVGVYGNDRATSQDRFNAIVGFGLPVMARHHLFFDPDPEILRPESWIQSAREELELKTHHDPVASTIVRRTVYFDTDVVRLRKLNSKVNAVTPGDDYDARTFAAGVALGSITAGS